MSSPEGKMVEPIGKQMGEGGALSFTLEADMIPGLTEALPALLVPRGPYAVAFEVPDGARVIDMMYASMPSEGGTFAGVAPFAGKLSRLSVAQTMVLALIWRERSISTPRLSAMTFIERKKLESEYLRQFERAGLIARKHRSWVAGPWGDVRPSQLVAVEAKLTDWRQALNQAEDNLTRADLSYIALPRVDARHKEVELIDAAKRRGVGVIELGSDGCAKIKVRARRSPARLCRHKWQLSVRLLADAVQPDGRWSLFDGLKGS